MKKFSHLLLLVILSYSFPMVAQKPKMCQESRIVMESTWEIPCMQSLDWMLIFEENFNGDTVNTEVWQKHYSSPPPADRILFPGGFANGEVILDRNSRVSEGVLILDVKKEEYVYSGNLGDNFRSPPELLGDKGTHFAYSCQYSAGAIIGKQAFSAKDYLAIESRIKIPRGAGLWPAFWTFTGKDEIDFFEVYDAGKDTEFESTVHGNFYTSRCARQNKRPDDNWHVWRAEISPYFIKIFIDGVEMNSFYKYERSWWRDVSDCGNLSAGRYKVVDSFPDIENGWFAPYFSVGVSRSAADKGTVGGLPAQMEVDWVKIYSGANIKTE